MAELDDVLRNALQRIAPDADPSGVADAIRARVDAGDTGTPASSSGFRPGPGGWWPFIALLVIAALLGGGIGLSGVLGHPVVYATQAANSLPGITATAPATATPSATVATTAPPVASTVPVAPPKPVPTPKDTTPPTLTLGKPNPSAIYGIGAPNPCATVATLATSASDASSVSAITAVSSFPGTIIHQSGPPTATTFTFSMPYSGTTSPDVTVTVTVTATDGAGNPMSQTQSFTLTSSSLCLI